MSIPDRLQYDAHSKPVIELVSLYEKGRLNLEPGFQRDSVWKPKDRQKLIESILRNYPLPAIFLYCREDDGYTTFDVIDGKQRLESILKFMGTMRGQYDVRPQLDEETKTEWWGWADLKRKKKQHLIENYRVAIIEVRGTMTDIIELFVRINSTGKALTRQEKIHAKYYRTDFLKSAGRIARRYEDYFLDMGVFNDGQISRMKHVELVCELMLSIHKGDVLNKKNVLDKVMGSDPIDGRSIGKAGRAVVTTLNRIGKMFPRLCETRFAKVTDFYTLAVLIARFEAERLILTDRKRNRLAWDLLITFSNRVDELRILRKNFQSISPDLELYREYSMTVQQGTDEVNHRRTRERILRGILESLFSRKDAQRGFTPEQRRLLWNGNESRKCGSCGETLTWQNFTIDHIDPHSKGGRSSLANAAIVCRSCNSSKGANRKRN